VAGELRKQGKSYREIAATMGASVATIHAALTKLNELA